MIGLGGGATFINSLIELAVVALAVELEIGGGVECGLVAAAEDGHLAAAPPELHPLRVYAADARLRQVLLVEAVEAVFENLDLIVLLAGHNPLVAVERLGGGGAGSQQA
ncbi:hypothetical protein [Hymenobacter sp. APR13]|uniref:hypothetical protein n=1 Tax=Hymenobacter sp. APR13 TaxID=1356852 RepID=UPI0005C48376|nr:hypothetical protein [Hymenobacter sp. APR13]